jgi:hypothetical protein
MIPLKSLFAAEAADHKERKEQGKLPDGRPKTGVTKRQLAAKAGNCHLLSVIPPRAGRMPA